MYTLAVRPDNSFEIFIDLVSVGKGNLLEDMEPPVNPPKTIPDPEDKKPEDWVDQEKIDDPNAEKPEDWDEDAPKEISDESATKPSGWEDDEPALIPDPDALMPNDWSEEEDGEWEAPKIANPKCSTGCGEWKRPMVPNPEYKGKWVTPLIDNPEYKGVWKAKDVDNPEFFVEEHPYRFLPIGAVGIEIWTMSSGILYDNLLVTHDEAVALDFAQKTFELKAELEKAYEAKKAKGAGVFAEFTSAISESFEKNPIFSICLSVLLVGTLAAVLYLLCFSSSEPRRAKKANADDAQLQKDEPKPSSSTSDQLRQRKSTKIDDE